MRRRRWTAARHLPAAAEGTAFSRRSSFSTSGSSSDAGAKDGATNVEPADAGGQTLGNPDDRHTRKRAGARASSSSRRPTPSVSSR